MFDKKVCVVGLGYIGLPTASFLAHKGYDVIGVDRDINVVDTINAGSTHIKEPELEDFVAKAVSSGKLIAYSEPKRADVFVIAVPTPFSDGFVPNLEFVLSACHDISLVLDDNNMIILESTSPVGTTEKIRDYIYSLRSDLKNRIYFAYAPERVLSGDVIKELRTIDRVVGGIDEGSSLVVKEFYESFVDGNVLVSDARTAEMSKLVENSYRDVNIAYANELSMLCAEAEIDVKELIKIANHHPRVNILNPGIGVGGHCIAVDPYFLIHMDKKNTRLISLSREINNEKTNWVLNMIKKKLSEYQSNNSKLPNVGCLGMAFKPNVDDLRGSPAIYIVDSIIKSGFNVLIAEPNISKHDQYEIFDVDFVLANCDIIFKLVAHKEFALIESHKLVDLT